MSMEEKVKKLWEENLMDGSMGFVKDEDYLEGIGNMHGYLYNISLNGYKDELYRLVSCIDINREDLHFKDLYDLVNGGKWTDFICYVEMLGSMLNAVGMLEVLEERGFNKNPRIKFNFNLRKEVDELHLRKEVDELQYNIFSRDKMEDVIEVTGYSNKIPYPYSVNAINDEINQRRLKRIVDQLDINHDELDFEDLRKKKDGSEWTTINQKVDSLATMMIAFGLLEVKEDTFGNGKKPTYKVISKSIEKGHTK